MAKMIRGPLRSQTLDTETAEDFPIFYLTLCLALCYSWYMNKLDNAKRAQIVTAIVEGCSIRSISRMTGASKNTIQKLVLDLGEACTKYMDQHFVNLSCQRIQCDEIWNFIAAKQANVTAEMREKNPHAGDCWTWVAIDADTKLVCSWMVGKRDWFTAKQFVEDIASRLANRVQLTS